jgi:hypothetical protein
MASILAPRPNGLLLRDTAQRNWHARRLGQNDDPKTTTFNPTHEV